MTIEAEWDDEQECFVVTDVTGESMPGGADRPRRGDRLKFPGSLHVPASFEVPKREVSSSGTRVPRPTLGLG